MSLHPAILIVEDQQTLAKNMSQFLQHAGFEVNIANTGEDALAEIESFKPDVVLLDYRLPDTDGLTLLKKIHLINSLITIIMVTGEGDVQLAVKAIKAGAYDYLAKPVVLNELKLLLNKVTSQIRMQSELSYYQNKKAQESGLDKMLGKSELINQLKMQIHDLLEIEKNIVDGVPASVLITGESGAGKELVARAFHFDGPRSLGPFIEINCSAIPEHLLEAELFGYERGAFTDAHESKMGLIESAHGGTLFLDEIGDMSLALQVKLLKLLEDRKVRRLGGLRDKQIDVRIITATNTHLEQMVKEEKFRADLYFRLRVLHIEVPPLRERGDDILYLARKLLKQHTLRYRKPDMEISRAGEEVLLKYSWPGNVRELGNMMEQAVLMAKSNILKPEHLPLNGLLTEKQSPAPGILADSAENHAELSTENEQVSGDSEFDIAQMEQRMVVKALQQTEGNVTKAAKLLGISRDALRYRMDKYQITPTS